MDLSTAELARYNRHIILEDIGMEGQEALKKARVLVIGAGGLGCPVLQYLVAAGVGQIGVVDGDVVEESNLHRQILFSMEDVGKPKAKVAVTKLGKQNPHIELIAYPFRITAENALELVKAYDIVVDGTDNFPTRYLLNDAVVIENKVLVFGSIFKFEGQVSVFNFEGGPTYRCLFPEPPAPHSVPNCAQVGVMGVLPGIIGALQANEVIKIITGVGEVLSGRLYCTDIKTLDSQVIKFQRSESAGDISELIDYEGFCGVNAPRELRSLSVDELHGWMLADQEFGLLDVREPMERQIAHIGGTFIPLSQLKEGVSRIDRDKPVVVYCHHGMRSEAAIEMLQEEYGFSNLWNLEGGLDEWSVEIDNSITRY